MKFKQILKRKVYPTWVSTRRVKGCKAYIFFMPRENYYHFQIECNGDVVYMSLTEGVKFNNFNDATEVAETWIRDNI